jgi:two-component system sensor histidine kinase/response regulator
LKYFLSILFAIGFSFGVVLGQDTSTVNHFNNLAASSFNTDPAKTLAYASQGVLLARNIHYAAGIANGLLLIGHANYFKGKTVQAIQNFNEAILIYKKLRDENGLSACYVQFGRMYTLLADYNKALNFFNMALVIEKRMGNERALTDCYKNMGSTYFSQGLLSKALDFYYNGLFIAVKNHYLITTAELYNNIGVILQNMEVYPNALEYYKKSISIFEETNDLQALGTLHENIAEILLAQGKYDEAIVHLTKANQITRKQSDQDGLSSVYTDLGLCYAYKKEFKKSINYLDTSLRIGIKYKIIYNQAYALIGFTTVYNLKKDYKRAYPYAVRGNDLAIKLGNLTVRANAALQISRSLSGLGRVPEAYNYINTYIYLKDVLKNNETIQKLTSYNYELNFSVKERLQAQQQHAQELLYTQKTRTQKLIILIFLILIIAMIFITIIYYRDKQKQKRINMILERNNIEILRQKTDLDEKTFKLNNLNTLKDRLISILAHDLRAPLSTLRGLFDLLQDDSISHQEMLDLIPTVLKKLEYTSDFLDTLLFWINSQMENFNSSEKSFSVKELLLKEMDNCEDQALQKGINLIPNIPDKLIAVADIDSIRIVVRNILTNAIKFSKEGDVIEVAAKKDNGKIIISVKDTGEGMTDDKLLKLFKSRVDSKNGTHNEPGTGMGLLFCKDLIEKCNGEIWAESERGKGSTFSFTVPAEVA